MTRKLEAAGIELPQQSTGNTTNGTQSGAESGAVCLQNGPIAPELAAVVEAWPGLPAAIKVGILAMVRTAK